MKSLLAAAFALTLAWQSPVRAADIEDYRPVYKALVAQRAAAIVTVKYVMAVTNTGNERRIEDSAQGVMVGADGLLLLPERAVSFDFGAMGGGDASGAGAPGSMVAKSSDFRVRLEGSDDWQPADLVTRDGELGLAWLRLRKAPAGLAFVDLSKNVRGEPGMEFYTLLRAGDDWGGVPLFRPGLVLGETQTPKYGLLVDGVPGLAFDANGAPMGFVDIDLDAVLHSRGGTGMGMNLATMVLRMTPAAKIAAATARVAKLPVAAVASASR